MSKLAGKYNRDLTQEIEKCKKDTIVFDGEQCVGTALDFVSKLKGDERKVKNRIVEYNLQINAHDGISFDSRIVLNSLPRDKRNFDTFKNGKRMVNLEVFNGYVRNNKIIKNNSPLCSFRMW